MQDKALQAARFGGERLKVAYRRYERFTPAAAFLAGTLLDVLTIGRIDQTDTLVQLGLFLVAVAVLLGLEVIDLARPFPRTGLSGKAWRYHDQITHFFLGSLLSAFTVLYLKSASLLSSLGFMLVIAACLVGNELSAMRRFGLVMRVALFAISLTSYLFCVTPVLFGGIGWLPFLTALALSGALGAAASYALARRSGEAARVRREVAYPYAVVLAFFLGCYVLRIIPPVPLSLSHIGIYHGVARVSGDYKVTTTRPRWKFWQRGDQSFGARPGDRVYCFFSVFSPGGFKETIHVRWLRRDDVTGWDPSDAVPVTITGGRDGGYRGFAFKQNFQPGDWQVRVETSDGREIGRIALTVSPVEAGETVEERVEIL